MLVIDPGTLRLPLRSSGEQCPPLHALYSFCIIPKSNPVPQGIFCLGVMFVQLDLSCRRRRRWRWAVPLVLAALLLALPQLAALRPAALARVDRVVGRHYMIRLDALQQENFTLHQQLAQSADALAENAALRQLVGCGRGITGVTPARVVARGVGGFTLACPDTAPGNAVLDAGGRYAGVVTRTDRDTCTVEFPAAAGLCGSYAGLVTPGQWQPWIIAALDIARAKGLRLPIVCNTGGYETVESVEAWRGYIDIWLADLKYVSSALSAELSVAPDYFAEAKPAIEAMMAQAGHPVFDADGILQKGVILRHLALPGHVKDSFAVLDQMAAWNDADPGCFLPSVMSQYTPFYKAAEHGIGRRITTYEYRRVVNYAMDKGLVQGYMQQKSSAKEEYTPSFDLTGV